MARTANAKHHREGPERVSLPRRGGPPLRIAARLLDEVRVDGARGPMALRLWLTGNGRLAVELALHISGEAVADAVLGNTLADIADWLEACDPSAPQTPPAADRPTGGLSGGRDPGLARLWEAALQRQEMADFRWLVGEALYRWHDRPAPAKPKKENAA